MRFKVAKIIYFVIIFLVILRLGYWQILRSDDLAARAESQRLLTKEVWGSRGKVLFSDGTVLASTQPSYLVYLQPKLINQDSKITDQQKKIYFDSLAKSLASVFWEEDQKVAKKLEELEGSPSAEIKIEDKIKAEEEKKKDLESDIRQKLNKDLYYVSLGRKVDYGLKKKIEKLGFKEIGFDESSSRFYPESSSSAHLLGFVGSDAYGNDTGYFGLEGYYNGELRGRKGTFVQEKDAMGLPILIGKFLNREATDGKTLNLYVDRTVQHIVEEKLQKGLVKYGAKSASAIVMDPQTGAILAMASLPSYDPGLPTIYPKENFKNPITADGYEPGSTFKVLIMAAALNENLVKPDTRCDVCDGPVSVGGYDIKTWNNQYQPNLTMTDTIIHSDNTGMVFVSQKLGLDKIYNYVKNFGFGQPTNIDLQDEHSPELREKKDWHEIDVATASFGQGISVTAIQVVRAVGALANGGKIMEPHVVSSIVDKNGTYIIKPKVLNTPISEQSAREVTEMMVRAVNEGEAKFFKPKGFKIAGKTGTAQIPVAGHYDPNKTIASFVGFAPADNPRFVMLVRYTQPTASIYGAETAAPTFFEISKELFTYYGIAPSE